ncbi:acyl-CoA carboxylase subunit epsilon [Arthrobacter polaris]|uniref:acyl-CoA carboxylase subunit epsilon n=1 Tax=Arthrobacter polaris TaxID=2813727 RepID=UPI001F373616|nr:acyl-CoA carboxylase subunit epsilon [Arthrobacter polaris]
MIAQEDSHEPGQTHAAEPLLSVTRGNPTSEELAAVTAVVLALAGGAQNEVSRTPNRHWARRAQLHLPPQPGAGAWRRSGR